jgi:hypothetical protein
MPALPQATVAYPTPSAPVCMPARRLADMTVRGDWPPELAALWRACVALRTACEELGIAASYVKGPPWGQFDAMSDTSYAIWRTAELAAAPILAAYEGSQP